jgi:ParB-like nuclease domain
MIAEMSFPAVSDASEITRKVELGDEYTISDIKVGSRIRRDLGNIDELARSIAEDGLLHVIVVRPDGLLIAGQRRLAACKKLGWENIPVRVVDLEQIARGEFAENAYRKGFLPSEIYAIWRALEPIERAAAEKRQRATRFGSGGGNFPPPTKGKTRDKVAACAGVSGRTVDKIAELMRAAEADPRYVPLVKMMDHTQCVNGAYKQLKAMRAAEAEAASDGAERPKASIQLSVVAYNEAFPQYPPLSEYNGVVYGTWLCGTSWYKVRLHGQYPPTFLKRALALFPSAKDTFHWPSGTVIGPGITIDLKRDDVRCPQLVADAADLSLKSESMDFGAE